jgi:hypothetical protein
MLLEGLHDLFGGRVQRKQGHALTLALGRHG